jgi:hypothetical protein
MPLVRQASTVQYQPRTPTVRHQAKTTQAILHEHTSTPTGRAATDLYTARASAAEQQIYTHACTMYVCLLTELTPCHTHTHTHTHTRTTSNSTPELPVNLERILPSTQGTHNLCMPSFMQRCSHTPGTLEHSLAGGVPTPEHSQMCVRGHSQSCNRGLPRDDIPSHPIPCMDDPSSHRHLTPHTHSCRPSHQSRSQHGIGQYPRRVVALGYTAYASISATKAHPTALPVSDPYPASSPPENS